VENNAFKCGAVVYSMNLGRRSIIRLWLAVATGFSLLQYGRSPAGVSGWCGAVAAMALSRGAEGVIGRA